MCESNYRSGFDRRAAISEQNRVYRRFKNISVSEKILNTCLLTVIGIGYLVALANMYFTHQDHDGKPGLSVQDVMINYHGSPDQTRLGSAIKGKMASNLKYKSDKDVILKWIQAGAGEEEYNDHIANILNRDCVICHTPEINPSLPNLTAYPGVAEVAHAGGASLPSLIRVSHIHLFGIAFILFFVGRIFILCDMNVVLKRTVVVVPFAAMLIDVMSWFITKSIPQFAYVVVASGALMGISMGLQILISIYQMWILNEVSSKAKKEAKKVLKEKGQNEELIVVNFFGHRNRALENEVENCFYSKVPKI
ncbi:MAG: hypothetical protein WC782_11340 [Methylococcaceae bacterium]|jgi:hypothetical protein